MQWEDVRDMEPILPPMIRRPQGRPKKMRKEVDKARKSGPKLSKIGQQANCTKFSILRCSFGYGYHETYSTGSYNGETITAPKKYENGRQFYIQTLDD
ncbi:hypothetical protein Goklo_006128 [Gossypium klotzschianum]|uniref:Uncharacterized protein n=1 Tax=Gossypium klotzschianum TaxID=34286 RepID=A0A7J8VGZ0_9ROSI|nr:hypothetical protein [Gossypium klotzschianum]